MYIIQLTSFMINELDQFEIGCSKSFELLEIMSSPNNSRIHSIAITRSSSFWLEIHLIKLLPNTELRRF